MMMVDGRGKLGGQVASKNRSGAYVRTKVTPTNPQTAHQANARNLLTSVSQAWRALTQAEITAWNNAVDLFAKTNIFGNKVQPSGKNLHQALNTNLALIGQSAITSPPAPAGAGQVVAGTAVATNGGAYSIAHTEDTAGHTIEVWATPGVPKGIGFIKNRFRLISTFVGGSVSPEVVTTAYTARFGEAAVGSNVSFRLVSVNNTTGEASVASESSTVTV